MISLKLFTASRQLQLFAMMAISTVIMGVVWILYNQVSLKEEAEHMYTVQADMIGSTTKAALMFGDQKMAKQLLSNLHITRDINSIQLFSANGKNIVSYPEGAPHISDDQLKLIKQSGIKFEHNQLKLYRTIFHKQEPVGSIYVEFNLQDLYSHQTTDVINILFIMLATLFFSSLITLHLQRRLTASEKRLRMAIQRAEAANRAKSDFLSTMSHELRTPIHGIIGLHKIIATQSDSLSTEQKENLELAQQSAESLSSLVNDILDITKIEAGKMEVTKKSFDLQACVCSAFVPFRPLALEKGITLSLHLESVPKKIIGDESRLRQILLNLVGNAMKFTHQGEVAVRVFEKEGHLKFTVRDTGIGISATDLKHIFEPFVQISMADTSSQKGTGLGTSIAKRFVELMGGHIKAESIPGQGSRFIFEIPYETTDSEIISYVGNSNDTLFAMTKSVTSSHDVESVHSTLRVLLAEDDPIGQRIAHKQLTNAGMSVEIVENGEDAWQAIQTNSYDLLLTDIRMPGLDGIELTRRIRALERDIDRPRMFIIGLSAHALEEVANECIEAGMDDFMSKPANPETILTTILATTKHSNRGDVTEQ